MGIPRCPYAIVSLSKLWRIFSISDISNRSGISFQQHIWKWNKASLLLLLQQVQVQVQWLNLHLFAFLLRVVVRVVRVVRVRVPPCPRHMYMDPQKRRALETSRHFISRRSLLRRTQVTWTHSRHYHVTTNTAERTLGQFTRAPEGRHLQCLS